MTKHRRLSAKKPLHLWIPEAFTTIAGTDHARGGRDGPGTDTPAFGVSMGDIATAGKLGRGWDVVTDGGVIAPGLPAAGGRAAGGAGGLEPVENTPHQARSRELSREAGAPSTARTSRDRDG